MASTVIEELVVLLDLDPSKLTEKQRQALKGLKEYETQSKKSGENIAAWGKKNEAVFSGLAGSALKFFSVVMGGKGLIDFSIATIASSAAIGRLATNLGISTKELSTWAQAVKLAGGDANAAAQGVAGFQTEIANAQLFGESRLIPFFIQLGVALKNADGSARSFTDIFEDVSEAIQRVPADQRRALLQGMQLDEGTITLLLKGRDAVKQYVEEAEKIGAVNKKAADSFQGVETAWTKFTDSVATGGRTFLEKLTGPITGSLDKITSIVQYANSHNIYGETLDVGAKNDEAFEAMRTREHAAFEATLHKDPLGRGGGATNVPSSGGISALDLIKKLERSKSTDVSSAGAIGESQILPETAAFYNKSDAASERVKLRDPAYNDKMAKIIEADLLKRFGGDPDALAVGYIAGPGKAAEFLRSGKNLTTLGPNTRDYLLREREIAKGSGGVSSNIQVDAVNVYTNATDGRGIGRDVKAALTDGKSVVSQVNTGAN